jgi:hypothetical protein
MNSAITLCASGEDYLEAVLLIQKQNSVVRSTAFAVHKERTSHISGCAMIRNTVSNCFAGSVGCNYRAAPGKTKTGKGDYDTPVQPQTSQWGQLGWV